MRRGLAIAFVLASIAPAPAVHAALIATSHEITVNTHPDGWQHDPSVAVSPGDGFVVVWVDNRFDNEGTHIRARKLGADLAPLADDVQVDVANDFTNDGPDVAALAGGGFVVVWRQGLDGGWILGRKLAADGSPIGESFRIDTARTGSATPYLGAPSVAPAADGGFVVAWASGAKTNVGLIDSDVYVRAFTAAGDPKDDDRLIVSPNATAQRSVDIRAAGDDGFVLVWEAGPGTTSGHARAQRLDANAAPVGSLLVDVGGPGPRVAISSTTTFHVISTGGGNLEAPYNATVRARGIDADSLADPFVLAERVSRDFGELGGGELAATAMASGDLVIAWTSGSQSWPSDGNDAGVYARVFDASGYPLSDLRQVNVSTAHAQIDPELERFGANGIVAVWESDVEGPTSGDRGEVYARLFEVRTPHCGDGTADGEVTATDALFALEASVGARPCARCLCDADDSGATSASDALALLLASVGLGDELACPECPTGPGIGIDLAVDEQCHGVHVEIPAGALPGGGVDLDCSIDPRVWALPCVSRLAVGPHGLSFDARSSIYESSECALSARTLLACRADAAAVDAMTEAAVVTCGCACAPECPAPRVCTSGGGTVACSSATNVKDTSPSVQARRLAAPRDASDPVTARTVTETSVVTSSVSTSSFTCGTCCNTPIVGEIELSDAVNVTELRVRLQGDVDSTCVYCEAWGSEIIDRDDGTVEFCIFRQEGIEGPTVLSPCFGNVGSITPGPAEVLRARGQNFEPIDPPVVVNDF